MVECNNCHRDVRPTTEATRIRTGAMQSKTVIRDECPHCGYVFEEQERRMTVRQWGNR